METDSPESPPPASAPGSAPASGSRRLHVVWLTLAIALLAALGAATLHWKQTRSAQRLAMLAAFDLNSAMDLAGTAVPPGTDSFYFFVLQPDASNESDELAEKFVQAAVEHDFVGITGADAVHNREVLLAALAIVERRDLAGLVIIYLGPPDQEAELQALVKATGAQFRFLTYQPAALQTI